MSLFYLYFNVGIHHILDFDAYDHILFISTLIAVYQLKQWRKIFILITAFTIGHATTLALSTLNIIDINPWLVELLIPITIIITAISNITTQTINTIHQRLYYIKYITAMVFGLIHGLGFSSYLKSMLDESTSITQALLAFNLGIEIGQIVVVISILSLSYLFINRWKVLIREWNLVLSGAGLGVAIILVLERFFG